MVVSDDEDNRELSSVDGDDDVDGEGCVNEVIIVEKSGSGGSTGSIFLLPERNEDNTDWVSHEGIKPATVFNKMKPDDIATARKRKQMLAHEVSSSVVDQWLRDQVNHKTWEKNIASFPEGKVSLPQ
jgi:hypothetical protein